MTAAARATIDVVVPSTRERSLGALLECLAAGTRALPGRVLVVDDRDERGAPLLADGPPPKLRGALEIVPGVSAGPAAARNAGCRAGGGDWVAFLDDDVLPRLDWVERLVADLAAAAPGVGGVQGRVRVPMPRGRRPTDWERNVAGLESARWATADMAYRREALDAIGGFDERFPRAYREDSDIGLRVEAAGWQIARGRREVVHPIAPASAWISVRRQAGNADDALMAALHGPRWRVVAGAPPGRRPRHAAIAAALALAAAGLALGRPRAAALAGAAWLAGTAELAWARIAPGPRTAREVGLMLVTSAAIPPAASLHYLRGLVAARSPWPSAR